MKRKRGVNKILLSKKFKYCKNIDLQSIDFSHMFTLDAKYYFLLW